VVGSGTVIYAGTTIGDHFSSAHGAMIREDNLIGDHCSIGTHAVLEPDIRTLVVVREAENADASADAVLST
jgi:UDP-3-O-[3-hydroxymyristoyl] glucosamine N-acyltransferase